MLEQVIPKKSYKRNLIFIALLMRLFDIPSSGFSPHISTIMMLCTHKSVDEYRIIILWNYIASHLFV